MLVVAPVFRFFACVLAFFALGFPVLAQDATPLPTPPPPLQMAVSSPFALTAKPLSLIVHRGRWFPLAVTLSNSGDPVSGTVRLRLVANGAGGSFENAPNDFYCPVDLPTNARKEIWLYGRLERTNVMGVNISLEGRGFQTLSQTVPVREPDEGQRLVLTVSDTDIGIASTLRALRGPSLYLKSLPGDRFGYSGMPPGMNGSSQGPIRPLETPRAGVPDRWFGLENADLIVLGDFAHSALSPPQVEALRGYVAGGGTLVALGGSNAARLASSPLADLWPTSVSTSNSAGAGEVGALVNRYVTTVRNGADKLGGAPVVVTRGALRMGAQLGMGSVAAPLMSWLDAGAGRAMLLGFDPSQPPFVGWSGQNELWSGIFKSVANTQHLESVDEEYASSSPGYAGGLYNPNYNPPGEGNGGSSATAQLLNGMAKAPQLRMPPVSQIAWFLALYVFVLVPLNYAVLRFIDRRELAWVTIPLIVGAFSVFAYSAALSIRGSAILTRQIDVVQGTIGSQVARADSLLWLFSPKRTTYNIDSSRPNAAVADYSNDAGGKQGAFSIQQPADATSFKVENANVWMWTDRAFFSQSLLDMKAGLSLNGRQLTNGTPFDLQGVVWVQDREVRRVGALRAGASAPIPSAPGEKAASVDLVAAIGRASEVNSIFPSDTVTNGIPASALRAALGSNFGLLNAGSFCIAWAKAPLAPLSIGVTGARSSDLSLIVFRVPPLSSPALAAREAIVTRLASEPITVASSVPAGVTATVRNTGASLETFECALPAAKSWVLTARGRGATLFGLSGSQNPMMGAPPPPGYPGSPPVSAPRAAKSTTLRDGQPVSVHFEAYDVVLKRWVTLKGELRVDGVRQSGWNFSAPISGEFARQPDRLMRVRVRCDTQNTRVSTLSVRRAGD